MLSGIAADPQLKRTARIFSAALLVCIFIFAVSPAWHSLDQRVFKELLQGFSELLPSLISRDAEQSTNSVALTLNQLATLLSFSFLAVFLGHRLSGSGLIVLLLQVLLLSCIFQLLIFSFFHINGHPVSLATAIACGACTGKYLKRRDKERRELEAKQMELKLRNDELLSSRLALVKQDESERRLLAADLHDQVLNDLRTIQKKFEIYAQAPESEARSEIDSLLKQSMSQIREIMDDLCPVLLEEFGLAAAIEDRLDKASSMGKFEARFCQSCSAQILESLSAVEKQLIYRLVQESLTNVLKHAEASLVRVNLDQEENELLIRISDNGKGIDPALLSKSSRGTVYMRLRAGLIGATVSWKQGPDNKGTTVEIRLNVQGTGS